MSNSGLWGESVPRAFLERSSSVPRRSSMFFRIKRTSVSKGLASVGDSELTLAVSVIVVETSVLALVISYWVTNAWLALTCGLSNRKFKFLS